MPRLRSHIPIEISSSSEPEPTPRPKRAQRTKASAVIELTDSEGDDDVLLTHVGTKTTMNAVAGPSSRRTPARSLQPEVGSSSSLQNIPTTPRQKTKAAASKSNPLFFPSDEENIPPGKNDRARNTAYQDGRVQVDVALAQTPPPLVHDEPEPERVASPEPDPQSTAMARILEIVPDVEPDYLLSLVTKYMLEHPEETLELVVEHILHALFEDPQYPKVVRIGKGKRKQTEAEAASSPKKAKVDYADMNRPLMGGIHYAELALELLQTAFPFIPKPHLRLLLSRRNGLYAPTHLSILAQEEAQQRQVDAGEQVVLPYNRRVTPYRPKGKGARKVDNELEAERKWLLEHLAGKGTVTDGDASRSNDADDEECEDGVECGCCFSEYPFDKLVQCPETHLFCKGCMKTYAGTLLGTHDPNIKCMDQSGCKALIPESELRRFLPEKLMALWERVKQRKDLEAAGLEDLEECPFCEWGCVIDNPDEKLLRCGNVDICGAVSCRGCKKLDHLPKSCKEMEEDRHLDGRHAVEEAMTQALMRNCPKCQKSFIKESGCNKMTCPNCHTLSCYVCRQVIKGYDHFNQQPGQPGPSVNAPSSKCLLWDSVEHRHAEEVTAAAERALKEYKRANPDVEEKDIKVDLPVAPPAPATGHAQPYLQQRQQLQRNAQALADQAVAALERIRAAEGAHRAMMEERRADLRLLNEAMERQPRQAVEYASRIRDLAAALGHDQARWYQMRTEMQQAQLRVDQARAQVALYGPQPVLQANVNIHPAMAPPVIPRAVARRPRAPARRRR